MNIDGQTIKMPTQRVTFWIIGAILVLLTLTPAIASVPIFKDVSTDHTFSQYKTKLDDGTPVTCIVWDGYREGSISCIVDNPKK